jgi:transcriptional regulator with XRE-family HTH domain
MKENIEGLLKLIRKRRKELKITQQEMAEHLGMVSNAGYRKLESGQTNIRLDQFVTICDKLGIDFPTIDKGKGNEVMTVIEEPGFLSKQLASFESKQDKMQDQLNRIEDLLRQSMSRDKQEGE